METRMEVKRGFKTSIPVLLGYIPIAISFGLLSKGAGLSLQDTFAMSFFVYAGASQFMAVDLISQGLAYGSIILATFLLNLRHFMMSASLSINLKALDKKYLPLAAFGITDESFAVASFQKEEATLPFILTLFFSAHTVWWTGSILGYLVGEILPESLQSSLSIGLYAMFVGLLFSQIKEDKTIIRLSLLSMLVYFAIYKIGIIGSGWDIILAILVSSGLGAYLFERGGRR